MIDKEYIIMEISYLRSRIADTTEAINEYRQRTIRLKQQKKKLRKELLENQQLLWKVRRRRMSCPDCGKKVPVLLDSLKEADNHCTRCLKNIEKDLWLSKKEREAKNDIDL